MISEAIGRKLALLGGFGLAARLKSTFQAALLVPHCHLVVVVADAIEGRDRVDRAANREFNFSGS
jgi:hypothetical protein